MALSENIYVLCTRVEICADKEYFILSTIFRVVVALNRFPWNRNIQSEPSAALLDFFFFLENALMHVYWKVVHISYTSEQIMNERILLKNLTARISSSPGTY